MISHIVMWKLKNEANGKTKQENAIELQDRLEALFDEIDVIVSIEVGLNSQNAPQNNHDAVLVTEFESFEDLKTYSKHPAHLKVVEFVKTIVEPNSRTCVDYEF